MLSVGAIAGYQKAIHKHQLNKWTEGLNHLLFNMYEKFGESYDFSAARIDYFVPDDFISQKVNDFNFYDKLKNRWGIDSSGIYVRFGGKQMSQDPKVVQELCPRFIEAMKEIGIFRLVIAYPKAYYTICNDSSCMMDYNSMNLQKSDEFCRLFTEDDNKDSIFYIRGIKSR